MAPQKYVCPGSTLHQTPQISSFLFQGQGSNLALMPAREALSSHPALPNIVDNIHHLITLFHQFISLSCFRGEADRTLPILHQLRSSLPLSVYSHICLWSIFVRVSVPPFVPEQIPSFCHCLTPESRVTFPWSAFFLVSLPSNKALPSVVWGGWF